MPGILLIEEKPETLERMQNILTEKLYIVFATRDSREGMEMANELSPDLILLNADIRHGRGIQMAKELKSQEKTKDIPLILLTTPYKPRAFIEEGVSIGADGFIFVPFDEIDFITKINIGMRIKSYIDLAYEKDREIASIKEELEEIKMREEMTSNQLNALEEWVEKERTRDILTGLYNSREFLNRLNTMVAECIRYEEPIVIFLYEFDHMQVIRENFGMKAMEKTILSFVKILKKHSRAEDIVARMEDNIFLVAYKRMRYDFIETLAERLQNEIGEDGVDEGDLRISYTATLGISCNIYTKDYRIENIEDELKESQIALRNAKRRGSGSIFIHPIVKKK